MIIVTVNWTDVTGKYISSPDEFKMQALSWKQFLSSDEPRGFISQSSLSMQLLLICHEFLHVMMLWLSNILNLFLFPFRCTPQSYFIVFFFRRHCCRTSWKSCEERQHFMKSWVKAKQCVLFLCCHLIVNMSSVRVALNPSQLWYIHSVLFGSRRYKFGSVQYNLWRMVWWGGCQFRCKVELLCHKDMVKGQMILLSIMAACPNSTFEATSREKQRLWEGEVMVACLLRSIDSTFS